ncbi:MAG TPA: argininosuccinate lyase [bacterium]|nr:argininosuccinate lyase [bacterium]
MMKLWAGRFSAETNKLVEQFTESISFDKRLYKYDIQGSIAHIKMLAKQKIVSIEESKKIIKALKIIEKQIDDGTFEFKQEYEDIHLNIESKLIEMLGQDIGGKLHIVRSCNDQVVVDVKLYLKDEYKNLKKILKQLLTILVELAKKNKNVLMPGFTHLQHAQPIYLAHYLLAYFQKFKRDLLKLNEFFKILDECPLGAGALAGTTHNIDRFYTSKLLDFSKPTDNSIDTVSDRDFILDYLYVVALIAIHLSQMSEEFIIWSSQEFNYITISDAFTTGSSIMPNKKNPDVCELARGKAGRLISNLNALMIMLKGLPMSYNRDLQDDKKILFDSADIVKITLQVFCAMLKEIKFNNEKLSESLKKGYIEATDIADYLVAKGIAFRAAHHISGELVKYAISKNKSLQDLSLEEYQKFSDKFDKDIYGAINFMNIVERRKSYGAASKKSIDLQINQALAFLK